MADAILVSKNIMGSLKQYMYSVPNITTTAVTPEQRFYLDSPQGTLNAIKVAAYSAGNTVTINSYLYEKSGVATPTVYSIYERTGDYGGGFSATSLQIPFINYDNPQLSCIYGIFRNTSNTATYTMTVALTIDG